MNLRFVTLSTLILAGWSGAASAQAPRDPAAAERLFRDALTLLDANDWAGACPKFEASLQLDPSVGTQINVARCSEHAGKLARAWSEFERARLLNRETSGAQRKEEVGRFLDETIARLEPRVPHLTVRVEPAPAGLRVERDGIELPVGTLGTALPLDPGAHHFVITAPGHLRLERTVDVKEGKRAEEVFRLEAGESPAPAPVVGPSPAPPPPPSAAPSGGLGGVQVAGLVIGGVGLATLAVSGITGALALGEESALEDGCTPAGDALRCADVAAAQDHVDAGESLATVSTITTFVGAAALGAGVVMLLVGGESEPTVGAAGGRVAFAPWFDGRQGGASLVGRF